MLNAEYGGSGGQEIESGMVVEEPDIEIGQGVSSKAISRRMGDSGPKNGLKYEDEDRPRYRRDDRRDDRRDEGHNNYPANTVPPVMPPFPLGAFPYPLPTLPNGLPMFPPGFTFPGQPSQTITQLPPPPPPGHNPS